jgi:hypothetical protein
MTFMKKIKNSFDKVVTNKHVMFWLFNFVVGAQLAGMYSNYKLGNYSTVIFQGLLTIILIATRYWSEKKQQKNNEEYEKLNIWKTLPKMSYLVINDTGPGTGTYLLVCPGFDTEQEYYFLWITDKYGTAIGGGGHIYPEALQILLDHANTKALSQEPLFANSGKSSALIGIERISYHKDNTKHLNETILNLLISTDPHKVKLGLNLYKN